MPSHQARRKPLPKDYQFPTPQGQSLVTEYRFSESVFDWVWPSWRLSPGNGYSHQITRVSDDDGDGYGHAV